MDQSLRNKLQVLHHSSIRICDGKTIYIDPFEIKEAIHDADLICITHDHHDHFDPESIGKICKDTTCLLLPSFMETKKLPDLLPIDQIHFISAGDSFNAEFATVTATPAYNEHKQFHTKEYGGIGYLIQLNHTTYCIAGDTDDLPQLEQIQCDVALLPVGGTYTMNAAEAAHLANSIMPAFAVPTHYGSVVGSVTDGASFIDALAPSIKGVLLMEE